MSKIFKFLQSHSEIILLLIIIIIASILRFYNINKLEFFTHDQSRDALFVKRIIVDHEFRLIGTQTSLPGMYLPPFYYYTIALFLWLFKLNPVGIDFYSASVGVLSVILIYFVSNKIFGKPSGIFSAGLLAVSPLIVEITRRSWNPNTLPFFILLSFYFIYCYFKERKTKDFLLGIGFYGYCLSLHFGAWTLFPLICFIILHFFWIKSGRERFKGAIVGVLLLLLFICPLIFFELRHNFLLSGQAENFFLKNGNIGINLYSLPERIFTSFLALFLVLINGIITINGNGPLNFSGKLNDLFALQYPVSVVAQEFFSISFYKWGIIIILGVIIASVLLFRNRNKQVKNQKLAVIIIYVWLFWGLFASLIYKGNLYFFYYLYLFPIPFLLFSFLVSSFWKTRLKIFVIISFLLIFFLSIKSTTVFNPQWRTKDQLMEVSKVISDNISKEDKFNIAVIRKESSRWDRSGVDYRYFVETFGKKRALDWFPENYQESEILFVIDETAQTDVLNSKIMEIVEFKPGEIINYWEKPNGFKIYKISKSKEK